MTSTHDLIACARTWLGTPYHHQGRLKGIACDCAGLIIGVAHELGLSTFDITGYAHVPNGPDMTRLLAEHLTRLPPSPGPAPGEILHLADGPYPCHLGLVAECDARKAATLIHAWAPARRVVEHHLDVHWLAKIRGFYRFPEVTPWQP